MGKRYTCSGIRKNKMELFGMIEGTIMLQAWGGIWRSIKKSRGGGFTENDKGEKNPEAT